MHEIDLRKLDLNLLVIFDVLMAERSVTRAAVRLARTQSAVSHALARLREQVGDALLVNQGGLMTPTPYALRLVGDLQPILRSIKRVLMPGESFDPATTQRVFRLAVPDFAFSLLPRLIERVTRLAPGASIEWSTPPRHLMLGIVEGEFDLGLVHTSGKMPEGVNSEEVCNLHWASFARRGHPALRRWGIAAWSRWPHVAVRVDGGPENPVNSAASSARKSRRVAVLAPNFSVVAPLLAQTDLIANLPTMVMIDALERFGIVVMPTPLKIPPIPLYFLWSARLANDPAVGWLRRQMSEVLVEALRSLKSSGPRGNAD